MKADRWTEVESLFHAALARPVEEREAFLVEACQDDPALREQVAALLAHDRTDASFIEAPALEIAARRLAREEGEAAIPTLPAGESDSADTPGRAGAAADTLSPGQLLGHFRIVRQIGEGGMGEVYLAEDLKLGRRVALKLLPTALVPDARARRRFLREARAASALNHPHIVTIHTIEEAEGLTFIIMEYIEGESLRERLLRGPMTLMETATMGIEVAEAIGAAHAINIVHRDLKPGNILLAAAGQAKIVDFGLAKAASAAVDRELEKSGPLAPRNAAPQEAAPVPAVQLALDSAVWLASFSQVGSIAGTIPYMSPEQTRGEHLDARSDIFSLGCVLYEAATGRRPFLGDSTAAVIEAIRTADPPPPSALAPGLPREFDRIVRKALSKEKEQRFATASELAAALRRLSRTQAMRRIMQRARTPIAVGVVLLVALIGWSWRRDANLRWAKENVARVPELAKNERFFEAYDLARNIEPYLPDDPILREWKPFVADILSVTTDPPGARVYLRRFQRDASGQYPPREFVGTTPIRNREIARGEYLLEIEKEGYAPIRRSLSNALDRVERALWVPGATRLAQVIQTPEGKYDMLVDSYAPIEIEIKLLEAATVPPRMVAVPGGKYKLVGRGRPTDEVVQLDDYFIDKFEVTNREYKEFLDAGGYENPAFWKHPFIDKDQELTWEEAMRRLTDRTGKPGPRGWRDQRYPAGKGDHPVTGVTWYEAAAYARFRGKSLPTVFQWEKAARDGRWTVYWGTVMPWGMVGLDPKLEDRANFYSQGTMPVESCEFGISPYGCYHMAGNVAEWCLNAGPDGFAATGASFHEGPNLFSVFGQFPGFYSSETLGFRCVLNPAKAKGDQGAFALEDPDERAVIEPVSEETFELFKSHYVYDPKPLEAKILEQVETDLWRRLKISYVGAAGQRSVGPVPDHKRALAYLWLPKNVPRPLQVVNYKPGGAVYRGLTVPLETEVVCKPILLSGRAVFVVVIEGMTERPLPADWKTPDEETVAYRDMFFQDIVDQRRGLDYLATRDDIDMSKIGNTSAE